MPTDDDDALKIDSKKSQNIFSNSSRHKLPLFCCFLCCQKIEHWQGWYLSDDMSPRNTMTHPANSPRLFLDGVDNEAGPDRLLFLSPNFPNSPDILKSHSVFSSSRGSLYCYFISHTDDDRHSHWAASEELKVSSVKSVKRVEDSGLVHFLLHTVFDAARFNGGFRRIKFHASIDRRRCSQSVTTGEPRFVSATMKTNFRPL